MLKIDIPRVNDRITNISGLISDKYSPSESIIGVGSFGSVRECTNVDTGDRCAIKSIRKSNPNLRCIDLELEISTMRKMNHGNIVKLIDIFEDPIELHIITSLYTGGDLFDEVERRVSSMPRGCFGEHETAYIIWQVLEAVTYMHNNNVAHRDLKPENIMFETREPGSCIKIIDFGLARQHSDENDPPMNTMAGTAGFMAPEVIRCSYMNSCDLWSVGVVTYILLCGCLPFDGQDEDEIFRSTLSGQFRLSGGGWSIEVLDFIRCLLENNPVRRLTADQALQHPWIVDLVVDYGSPSSW